MHDLQPRHRFPAGEPRPDRHVVDVWISGVLLGQRRFVRMVHRQDDRHIGEVGERGAGNIVEVHEVGGQRCIAHCPPCVIEVLQLCADSVTDGPVAVSVPPLHPAGQSRFAVRVKGDVMTARAESPGEICDEQFGSAVGGRRDRNEGRCNQSDAHVKRRCKNDHSLLISNRATGGSSVSRTAVQFGAITTRRE